MRHEKKTWPQDFEAILDGQKTFDLRLADWKCEPGDTLVLREWDPDTEAYTGRIIEKEVTHILKTNELTFWPKEEIDKYGFQVISFH
ncbi:MAG: DUF3850 domain-containing protein [Candidatus Uhrbacteria bacterium]